MRKAILTRGPSTDDGTFGKLVLDDGTTFFTGELPWDNNNHGTSCIPPGPGGNPVTYTCKWIFSPKHGECYEITDVKNRDKIEIHSANFMGNTAKGKLNQMLGCAALGKSIGVLEGQKFEDNMNKVDFELTIK
jgi:hypothetical protein